ncbi:hypothetical protein LOK49_LG02G01118 [Camellia lanceoleosa]|uniref:Uncharacterized protein n=1 Tax=Camellia lanceoleosa TaxID=1840588 RepID=A0ACC0INQ3_9ERIC|nr:hypothetical protein LOK49_LG02G01118 [Camellia lanceoleosa]
MVSGVSRKRPIASNRRRARQTKSEALEVNVPVEEDDHVDVNNDYVDDDVSVEDDDVDNDIGVEADLIEDDVGVDDDNTEPVPGAQEDPSLLISFRNHVAAAIWKKKSVDVNKMANGLIWATTVDLARNSERILSLYRQLLRRLNSPDLPLNLAARLAKKAEVRAIFMLAFEERSLHNIEDLIDAAEYSLSLLRKGQIP